MHRQFSVSFVFSYVSLFSLSPFLSSVDLRRFFAFGWFAWDCLIHAFLFGFLRDLTVRRAGLDRIDGDIGELHVISPLSSPSDSSN